MKRQLSNEPLNGVAVYNPGILSKQELIRLFVARRSLLQQIIDDLMREAPQGIPQHRLLVGARGMGKTMLLRRISYAVEDNKKLSRDWLPLTFPEEQYNVARLSDLWLNCLDAVSDALERNGKHDEAEALDEIIDFLPNGNEEERARKALKALLEQAQKTGQRLLLLIDNIDLIFERLAKEHWTIREMLSKEGAPLLIGATSRPLEPTYEYHGAFYDFFKISNLNKLQLEEMHEVLRTLSIELNAPQVIRLLEQDPARIRVLYDLTGGNPRTTILLFTVFAQGIDGDVRSDLERLLDQCTPLYKARFEELPSQAQQVVDALALHWDPASAAAVAERSHLDVNSVSSHLNRLSEQGVIEKVRLYPKKKTGFQIAERFFNIWYLMRASRRMRRKLIWLSKFLKSFYSQEDLHNLARRYFAKEQGADGTSLLKHAEYGFALADALDDRGWRRALEHSASRITMDIHDKFRELLSDSAIDLEEVDQQTLTMKKIREKILNAKVDWGDIDKQEFCGLLCGFPTSSSEHKNMFAERIENMEKNELQEGYRLAIKAKSSLQNLINNKLIIDQLYQACDSGLIENFDDVVGAEAAAHLLNEPVLVTFMLGMRLNDKQDNESLGFFKTHLEKINCKYPWAWEWIGNAENELGLYAEAVKAYRKAIELAPEKSELWFKLGTLLGAKLNRNEDAMPALEKAVELDPTDSAAWCNYGNALTNIERVEDGGSAYRKAVELDPRSWEAWVGLGNILFKFKDDYQGAEKAYRSALAINTEDPDLFINLPRDSALWNQLGVIQIYPKPNIKKAEKSFRTAIELNPKNDSAWNNLAKLLNISSRYAEAEEAYRLAVQLKPEDLSYKIRFASILVINKKWPKAATVATSVLHSDSENKDYPLQDVLSFFKTAVTNGYMNEAIILLEQSELDDSWRPLVEALKAMQAGSVDYFFNIAPEVRSAAEEIYAMLMGKDEDA
jgi:tetratricopeptide (TPR) repeat protein